MDKIRILIIDDHTIMRDSIRAILSLHDDIEIVGEGSGGKEAIEKTQDLQPDVVVMDILMPGIDGIEATRNIMRKNPGMKILILTQYENKEFVLSAIKAGASGYMPKTAVGSDLALAIRTVNNGHPFLYSSATTALIEDYQLHIKVEPYERLTGREREILKLMVEGYTSRQMAEILPISLKSVQRHRVEIMNKLNIHKHSELVKYALRKGLVLRDTEKQIADNNRD